MLHLPQIARLQYLNAHKLDFLYTINLFFFGYFLSSFFLCNKKYFLRRSFVRISSRISRRNRKITGRRLSKALITNRWRAIMENEVKSNVNPTREKLLHTKPLDGYMTLKRVNEGDIPYIPCCPVWPSNSFFRVFCILGCVAHQLH